MLNFVSADILNIFVFFPENRIWHFMQIVSKCQMFIPNMLSTENAQSANHQFSSDDIFE